MCGLGPSEIVNLSSITASSCKYLLACNLWRLETEMGKNVQTSIIWQPAQCDGPFSSSPTLFIHTFLSIGHLFVDLNREDKSVGILLQSPQCHIFDRVWADSLVILCIFSQQICWNIFALHPSLSSARRRCWWLGYNNDGEGGEGEGQAELGGDGGHMLLCTGWERERGDANTTLILSGLLSLIPGVGEDTGDALIRPLPGSINNCVWKGRYE